jgi:phage terminase Nu1 subunit (DNA packaging protein)
MADWQKTCVALWGEDWIAPLSEVLDVNRRTVARWKVGDIQIPAHIAADIVRLPKLGTATRAYGEILRRVAHGDTVQDIENWMADIRHALAHYQSDVGKYPAIDILSGNSRKKLE